MTTVLCISGGVDSVIAWFYENKPKAVYFDLGTKYTQKEIDCLSNLSQLIPDFNPIIDYSLQSFGQFETGRTAFIPQRNMLFATICAAKYGDDIIIGGIKGDNVCDKNPVAFQMMSHCLATTGGEPITVRSPFWDMTKPNIIAWFIDNVPDALDILRASISCYGGSKGSCGLCPSCIRKWFALKYLGIDCDSWFESHPKNSPEIPGYIKRLRDGVYDLERTKEMFKILESEIMLTPGEWRDLQERIAVREHILKDVQYIPAMPHS